jgi:hypothetical protein
MDKNKKCCWNCKYLDRGTVKNLRGSNGYTMLKCCYEYEIPKLPECVGVIIEKRFGSYTAPVYGEKCEVFEKRV